VLSGRYIAGWRQDLAGDASHCGDQRGVCRGAVCRCELRRAVLTDILASLACAGGLVILLQFWRPSDAELRSATQPATIGAVPFSEPGRRTYCWLSLSCCGALDPSKRNWNTRLCVSTCRGCTSRCGACRRWSRPAALLPAVFQLNWLSAAGPPVSSRRSSAACSRPECAQQVRSILHHGSSARHPCAHDQFVLGFAFLMNYTGFDSPRSGWHSPPRAGASRSSARFLAGLGSL